MLHFFHTLFANEFDSLGRDLEFCFMLCSLSGQGLFVMAPECRVGIVAHFFLSGIPALRAKCLVAG